MSEKKREGGREREEEREGGREKERERERKINPCYTKHETLIQSICKQRTMAAA